MDYEETKAKVKREAEELIKKYSLTLVTMAVAKVNKEHGFQIVSIAKDTAPETIARVLKEELGESS